MNVLIKLNEPLGNGLGPNFYLTSNVGVVSPFLVTKSQLLTGITVSVTDGATKINITSQSQCTNFIEVNIAGATTTTTTNGGGGGTTTTTTSGGGGGTTTTTTSGGGTTTTTTTSSTSTTSTTTALQFICFCIHVEGLGCGYTVQLPISGNAPEQNGKPVYNFTAFGVFGYVYYNGTEWVYKNTEEGFVQPLNNSNFYPFGTYAEWGSVDVTKYMNSSTLGPCPTTTTSTSTQAPCIESCYTVTNPNPTLSVFTATGCLGVISTEFINENSSRNICAVSVDGGVGLIVTRIGDCSACTTTTTLAPTTTTTLAPTTTTTLAPTTTTTLAPTTTTTLAPTTTTSTTTIDPASCFCYIIDNLTDEPISVAYNICNGNIRDTVNIGPFGSVNVCAVYNSILLQPGVIVIGLTGNPCLTDADCNPVM